MSTSQNGWTVVDSTAMDRTAVHGVAFPNGFRAGDVAYVLRWFFGQFHARVEQLVTPGCWGYDKREIDDSGTWSNHASGTAGDANAPQHPRGKRGTFSSTKLAALRQLLAETGGVIRWGGDFTTIVDEMHFEIHGNAAAVAALADKIKGEDEMTDEDMRKLAGYIGAAVADKVLRADLIPFTDAAGTTQTWKVATALGYITTKSREIAENTAAG